MTASMFISSKAFLEEEDLETCPRLSQGREEQLAVPTPTGTKMSLRSSKLASAKWTVILILAALEQTFSQFILLARVVMLPPS